MTKESVSSRNCIHLCTDVLKLTRESPAILVCLPILIFPILRLHGLMQHSQPRSWQEEQCMHKKSVMQSNGFFSILILARIMAKMGYLNISRFTEGLFARKNICFMCLPVIVSSGC